MLEYEGSGKNVEKAIEDALFNLKAPREDVDIKILDTGGLFRKAKVLVTISDDCKEKYLKKCCKEQSKDIEQSAAKTEEKEVKEVKEVKEDKKDCCKEEESCSKTKDSCKENSQDSCKNNTQKSDKQDAQNSDEDVQNGKAFLEGFLKTVNLNGEVCVKETEDEVYYIIKGEDVSSLIGFRGECLNALQFLTSVINGKTNRKCKKVRLDIDGYREKRKQTLTALAHRICRKVLKTGHSTRLEPMSAYERRIIHSIVTEEYPTLASVSKGEEPRRFLTISLKK